MINSGISGKAMKTGFQKISCFGIKKQCVEFSRRWLYINKGVIYQDVKLAADIWNEVNFYTRISDGIEVEVSSIVNGAECLPRIGDLIIYSEKFMSTGHVSVVVNVNNVDDLIELHEQNFDNHYQLPNQKRCISFVFYNDAYWLLDSYLLGWKSMREA